MKPKKLEPLYRRVNTKARGVHHDFGSDYKHDRNTKQKEPVKMKQGVKRGLDYTPLYKFLLKHVGKPWDKTYSIAVSRLDKPEPIFNMVAKNIESASDRVRVSESSYYSGLFVDKDGVLKKVNPEVNENTMEPSCPCCTHTFNGKVLVKKHEGYS
jgi:hypothetical protein